MQWGLYPQQAERSSRRAQPSLYSEEGAGVKQCFRCSSHESTDFLCFDYPVILLRITKLSLPPALFAVKYVYV